MDSQYTIYHLSVRGRKNYEVLVQIRDALERADMYKHMQQNQTVSTKPSEVQADVCDTSTSVDENEDNVDDKK